MSSSQTQIYILQLQYGKYYVGKTANVHRRYQEHQEGNGSAWTKKYRPIKLIKTIPETSPFDEDKYTKEYMALYGIQNVRGGSYTCIQLDDEDMVLLQKEIRNAKNQCSRCGRSGHYRKSCYATTDEKGQEIESESDSDSDSDSDSNSESESESESYTCYRCGREGHYASHCYASYHKKGYRI